MFRFLMGRTYQARLSHPRRRFHRNAGSRTVSVNREQFSAWHPVCGES